MHAPALLQQISNTDTLTQLHNRRHFNEIFAAEFKRAFRDKTPLSIRLVNIDHFKMINDTFGHPFGNVCLASAAGAVPDASDSPASLLKAADLLLCRAKKKGRNRIESSIE